MVYSLPEVRRPPMISPSLPYEPHSCSAEPPVPVAVVSVSLDSLLARRVIPESDGPPKLPIGSTAAVGLPLVVVSRRYPGERTMLARLPRCRTTGRFPRTTRGVGRIDCPRRVAGELRRDSTSTGASGDREISGRAKMRTPRNVVATPYIKTTKRWKGMLSKSR